MTRRSNLLQSIKYLTVKRSPIQREVPLNKSKGELESITLQTISRMCSSKGQQARIWEIKFKKLLTLSGQGKAMHVEMGVLTILI
jgi:hypothetical protein